MTRRLLIVLALLGIIASACTLGPREEWAKGMRDASESAAKIGSSKVHVTVAVKVIETTIRVLPNPVFVNLDGIVDYKNRTTKAVSKGGAGFAKSSTVFYDDVVTYLPRSPGSISDHNSKLHWARFDFSKKQKPDKIDANDKLSSLGYVISPALAVELLQGILAGSLKERGRTQIDGATVTEYAGKLAPDAAIRDLRKQSRVDGITRMFKIIGAASDIFPVHVWMDSQGLARRIQFVLTQQEDVVDKFRTTVDYTFTKFGPSVPITLPPRADSLGHKRFVDFVGEYTRAAI